MEMQIQLTEEMLLKKEQLIRMINFASQDILTIESKGNFLQITLNNESNEFLITNKINRIINDFLANEPEDIILYQQNGDTKYEYLLPDNNLVEYYGNGLIAFKKEAAQLLRYFDRTFSLFSKELQAEEPKYPTLLPIDILKRTSYLNSSPQYQMFVCHPKEDMDELLKLNKIISEGKASQSFNEPQLVLSPAACFHCYMDYENVELPHPVTITFNQNVFRNEGRNNWGGIGRLADYTVREIVFFGSMEYVVACREQVIKKTKDFVEKLNLDAKLCVTCDPFVVPVMQRYKKIQIHEKYKYEMQLGISPDKYLATASFNLHGSVFSKEFNIRVRDVDETVSGCVGFGLERWVLAFLAQFGTNPNHWPKQVIEQLK
ncbi:TPA: hypothetical protein QCZ17_003007 [Bacillus cereus]|nr:hypothetical protein [Bacillus cereus]